VYLSMSSPVNIAISVLFPPGIAAAIVASSSLSEWEIRGQTTISHAIYNRTQLGLSAAAAAAVYRACDGSVPAVLGSVAAVIAYHTANSVFVALAETTCRRVPARRAFRGLLPPGVMAPIAYLMLGLMGVALARTGEEVGSWAVALLVVPLLGARQAVAASGKLEQSQRAQRMLANRLIDERERERVRIAASIHDVVLQDLAGVQLTSSNVRTAIETGNISMAQELARRLEVSARDAVASLRDSIANLRRTTLDDAGLPPTLARYARSFSAQTGIDVTVSTGADCDVPSAVGLLLYECFQEAMRNVARHAHASHVEVTWRRDSGGVELRMVDDGVGFHRDGRGQSDDGGLGVGLSLARDKVELSGGSLSIATPVAGGTVIVVNVPLEASAQSGW